MEGIQTLKGSWPWPWPWIRPYGIPSCITHRPLPTYQISFKSKQLFVDGRTYGRTDGRTYGHFPPLILLGRLLEVDLKRTSLTLRILLFEELEMPARKVKLFLEHDSNYGWIRFLTSTRVKPKYVTSDSDSQIPWSFWTWTLTSLPENCEVRYRRHWGIFSPNLEILPPSFPH